jgi:haloalkane dehalogenase
LKYLRTDDRRFLGLPDFPFDPNYLSVDDTEGGSLRLHYVDEGVNRDQTILCLHGEPSWCFLYRHMIKVFVAAGYRVIAPDLIGFGRSDKPTERNDHTYKRHVDWMAGAIAKLQLRNVTLFCQDWGGLIGLRLVGETPDLFSRVVTANTSLPTGAERQSPAYLEWRALSQSVPTFPVGQFVKGACHTELGDAVVAAYDAPFPDESYKAGVRQLPLLVPIAMDDPEYAANKRAWEVLENFDRPWLTIFSGQDPITRHGERIFQRRVKGAQGQPHVLIPDAGHFLQEDKGAEVARIVVEFMRTR